MAAGGGRDASVGRRTNDHDRRRRVAYEDIDWDQATLLVQVGLLDPALHPVHGQSAWLPRQAFSGSPQLCYVELPPNPPSLIR